MTDTTLTTHLDCEICQFKEEHGWWGIRDTRNLTHCAGCHFTWPLGTNLAHCVYCHRSFTGPTGYDHHLKVGNDGKAIFHTDPYLKSLTYRQDDRGVWTSGDPDSTPRPAPPWTAQEAPQTPPRSPTTSEPSAAPKIPQGDPSPVTVPSWLPKPKISG